MSEALASWHEEKRSAYLYRAIAVFEPNAAHQQLFLDLAAMADQQALIWQKQLSTTPIFKPDIRVRIVIRLVKWFGVPSMRMILAAMKIRGMSIYQAPTLDAHPFPTTVEEMEYRHRSISKGNNLRAAVFGVNDGLISNACLIMGVAGANASVSMVLLTGIAGLLAGASSMGAGEYISVRSQREMLEYQLKLEKDELDLYPDEEAAELALIYQARGLPKADAERFASVIIKNPEHALKTLAREELGIDPDNLASPIGAAVASFISFAIGALIPLLPYVFHLKHPPLGMAIFLTGLALFSIGAVLSLFTQKSAILGGLRMLAIGALAGAATYFVGGFFGVNVS